MTGEFTTVGRYSHPLEAHQAAAWLEEAGVEAVVTGELTNAAFPGLTALGAQIELRVPTAQTKIARDVLAAFRPGGALPPAWDEDEDEAVPDGLWICTLCDEAVSEDVRVCPACRTRRDSTRKGPEAAPPPAGPAAARSAAAGDGVRKAGDVSDARPAGPPAELTEDLEAPPVETFLGDDLARRAFRAAILGLLLWPLMIYALWLQYRLAAFPGALSDRGQRDQFWAALLILAAFLVLAVESVLVSAYLRAGD